MDYGDFTDPMDPLGLVDPMESTDLRDQSHETVQTDTRPPAAETHHSPTNTNSMNAQTTTTRPPAAQVRALPIQTSREVERHLPNLYNLATSDEDEQHSQRHISATTQRTEVPVQSAYDSEAPSGRPVGFRRAVNSFEEYRGLPDRGRRPAHTMARERNAFGPVPNLIYPMPRSGYEPITPMEAIDASGRYVPPHLQVPGRGTAETNTPMEPSTAIPSHVPAHIRVPGRGAAGTNAPTQASARSRYTPYVPPHIGMPDVVAPGVAPTFHPTFHPTPRRESDRAGRDRSDLDSMFQEYQAMRNAYLAEFTASSSRAQNLMNRMLGRRALSPLTSNAELLTPPPHGEALIDSDEDEGDDLPRHGFRPTMHRASGSGRTRVPGSQHRLDPTDARRADDEVPNLHRRADRTRPAPKTDAELTVSLSCKVCFEQPCTVVVLPCRKFKPMVFFFFVWNPVTDA